MINYRCEACQKLKLSSVDYRDANQFVETNEPKCGDVYSPTVNDIHWNGGLKMGVKYILYPQRYSDIFNTGRNASLRGEFDVINELGQRHYISASCCIKRGIGLFLRLITVANATPLEVSSALSSALTNSYQCGSEPNGEEYD
ncbi:hypothetical protein [Yersinia aldovae]|uniref:hypothetical protein n=1 Tax=Yersinia aldovae TaxID=29483 RepID=UPI0005AC9373|nr:hypothetical protein [Yersinia aldovae]AJJ61988.1 hypothetical protein AT01_149 [Yersinia aldovae 670-83]